MLADEGGPFFVGAAFQLTMPKLQQFDRVAEAFRSGGGVAESAYAEDLWAGQARFSAGWVEHLLTQAWVPSIAGLDAMLRQGAAVADLGCGRGLALIKLAQTYPESYFVGYDAFEPEILHATENARAAGVADRVRFQHLDASRGLPSQYDVITTFDVVHDAVDPNALLRSIRQALKPNGVVRVPGDQLRGPTRRTMSDRSAALFHAISLFYCMTTSLAHGGAGLGTLGLPESRLRELCLDVGFRQRSTRANGQSVQCAVRDPPVSSRPLRFGMTFLRQDDWDRVVEQVERYEAMGLDSAWVADHFVFPWDPTRPVARSLVTAGRPGCPHTAASSSERWSAT